MENAKYQEIIDALRCCISEDKSCNGCPYEFMNSHCKTVMASKAADAIEELMNNNGKNIIQHVDLYDEDGGEILPDSNEPLTLEGLRTMSGRCIWWEYPGGGICMCKDWYVISSSGTYSHEFVSKHGKAYKNFMPEDAKK